jgi:hypothetical protein
MPRIYTVPIDNGSITNANGDYELFELDPATDKPIEICGWDLGQLTELQEAQEEQLRVAIISGNTTDGTGGSSVTPVPTNPSDAAAGFTADILRTAIATVGTATTKWAFSFPVRSGHQWGPVPEGYGFGHVGTGLLVMRLVAAVADDLTFQGSIMVREY